MKLKLVKTLWGVDGVEDLVLGARHDDAQRHGLRGGVAGEVGPELEHLHAPRLAKEAAELARAGELRPDEGRVLHGGAEAQRCEEHEH